MNEDQNMNEDQIFELLLKKAEELRANSECELNAQEVPVAVLFKEMAALIAAVSGLSHMVVTQAKKIEELEDEIKVTREYAEYEIDDLRFDAGL